MGFCPRGLPDREGCLKSQLGAGKSTSCRENQLASPGAFTLLPGGSPVRAKRAEPTWTRADPHKLTQFCSSTEKPYALPPSSPDGDHEYSSLGSEFKPNNKWELAFK